MPLKLELKFGNRSLLIGILTVLVLLSLQVEDVSGKIWLNHDISDKETEVMKPVDPVFINGYGSPIHIEIGEEWGLFYPLEADKRYHIVLVGDWINNGSDPLADYDIAVYDPYSRWMSIHTESAGLPEQVANDFRHWYFIPEVTGEYEFRIINDPRDSKNETGAIFMVIEHIDINEKYSRSLEGRDTLTDKELLLTSWAYEFNTSAPHFRIFVDVPSTLDMYEARLYAMANPKEEVGYNLYGVGAPVGTLFEGFQGAYGGFNTSCKGDRNPLAMASCEYSGEDMKFTYQSPSQAGNSSNIFYYLVLIAEHGTGTVKFQIQTDYTAPKITLIESPEKGYAREEIPIAVSITEDSEVERVWVEFTDDDGETWDTEELELQKNTYVCELPRFSAGANVNYTIFAEDAVGNIDSLDGWFPVKNKATLECSVSESTVKMGRNLDISGRISPPSEMVQLQFQRGEQEEIVEVVTDISGYFTYSYDPSGPGEWTLRAISEGNEFDFPSSSNVIEFMVDLDTLKMSCSLSANEVKQNQPVTVTGMVTPAISDMPINVMFSSPTSYIKETVTTDVNGGFSHTFATSEVGVWNVLAEVKGDSIRYASSQSSIMEFIVVSLTVTDKVSNLVSAMITPPLQYLTIGAAGVGTTLVIYTARAKKGNGSKKSSKKSEKKSTKYSRHKK